MKDIASIVVFVAAIPVLWLLVYFFLLGLFYCIARLFNSMTPTRMLLLTPLLMLALAVQLNMHGGGKPRHFGPMVGDQGGSVHLWMRPATVDPDNWITDIENMQIDAFNRRQGVRYAAK